MMYNDLVGIQDYRNCEFLGEWASVWNYLYHEYVPPFQSNPRRGDRFWQAHCCVDGQMPFLLPSVADGRPDGPALNNGTFERVSEDGRFFPGWENHAGKHHPDGEIKHGGMYSLRLEVAGTNRIQVSQNLPPAARRIQLSMPSKPAELFTSNVGLASSRFVMTTYEAKPSSVEMPASTG